MSIRLRSKKAERIKGVVRGVLARISAEGEPQVDFHLNTTGSPVPALSTISLRFGDIGREAILMFEDGDAARPIVMGLVACSEVSKNVAIDGQQVAIAAEREVTLRCGDASITLTRAGKVIIQGSYVVSRSSGANRLKGACVQIN